jgi:hypothetical protein
MELGPNTTQEAFSEYLKRSFSVRSLVTAPEPLMLRKAIDDTVVAFVPSTLPLTSTALTCTNALVQIQRTGGWWLNARLETPAQAPIAFILGFVFNEHRFFGWMFSALNVQGFGPDKGFSSPALLGYTGGSQWLRDDYAVARNEGVTFGLLSTLDMKMSLNDFGDEWLRLVGGAHRPLSILDTDSDDTLAWSVVTRGSGGGPAPSQLLPVQDPGLSFEVSLWFE